LKVSRKGDRQGIEKELQIERNWSPAQFPAWLVFEVESQIQIWPEQAAVARHLIENSAHVVQLNMGMGKTRVIIPLLILHWTYHCVDSSIPRINILPALISEADEFFHRWLTSSVFHLKLFSLPFSRDIDLNAERIRAIGSFVSLCREHSGFFLVAPEHRLSLELKINELFLAKKSDLATSLKGILDGTRWMDILDESDELLHHRFQLIYAYGSVEELPSGPHRWQAAQSLLRIINSSGSVRDWMKRNPQFVAQTTDPFDEGFRPISITSRPSLARLIPEFYFVVAEALLDEPPHDLEWMKDHALKKDILASLVDEASPSSRVMELCDEERNDILALRGLLVGGILVHCLRKRHRVDFGVARPGKKKLSVPFRGADTPSLR
jgi:hypothetical protein